MIRIALVLAVALALAWPAAAQSRKPALTGDPVKDIGNAISQGGQRPAPLQANPLADLAAKIDALALPDFEYALALAKATNNVVSQPCWQAWVDLLQARNNGVKDANGNALTEPNPHIITDVERLSEAAAMLRPDSDISIKCTNLAAAGAKDIGTFITSIITGSALGGFKLPIPIGPIP